MKVAFTDILAARRRIGPYIHHTQQRSSPALTGMTGQTITFKCEHQQTTGAFKLRGATNAVLSLSDEQRKKGICAASTGNHGRAVAFASRNTGAPAVICMSKLVPENKVAAIRSLGAQVRIVGKSQDEAQDEVDRLVDTEGMTSIPPFDHMDVIAGQGTIGLEMLEEAPELDAVLVPLSGGGLIAGVALAVKTLSPGTKVIGISMERGAAMIASLAAGRPVMVEELPTLADSLGGGIGLANTYTFEMVRDLVDDTIRVSEREIAEAIRFAYMQEAEVLEGAAAVGIAALMTGKFVPSGPTSLVLSGKSIAPETHLEIVSGAHQVFHEEA